MAVSHSLIFLAYPPARQLMARAEGSSREQAFGLRPWRAVRRGNKKKALTPLSTQEVPGTKSSPQAAKRYSLA